MSALVIAVIAAVSMLVQDILGVLMVQAEARNHGWIAGWCDTFQWYAAISTTTISVTALQGNDLAMKILVIALVSAANLFGSRAGVAIGRRFIKDTES